MNEQGVLLYNVPYPERLSRLLIFVKWLLAIPHYVVLYVLYFALSITTFVAWFAILFTGHYPRGLWDFAMMVYRWNANVAAYVTLLRDEYPPFGGNDGDYPVLFQMEYPERLSRLLIFVKWLLVIPHLIVLYVLGIVAGIVWIVAWFAILITGNVPRAMFDFLVGVMRWSNRVTAYVWLLTDVYPPFSLGPTPTPPSAYAPYQPAYPA
jgi:hypothetical protein